jgi:putative membrane protein
MSEVICLATRKWHTFLNSGINIIQYEYAHLSIACCCYLSLAAVAAVLSFVSCGSKPQDSTQVAEAENDKKLDTLDLKADGEFAVAAADGGMLEVTLGKLAQTKSTTPAIQELGKTMALDHSKAGEELKTIAGQKNITLPDSLSQKNQRLVDDLTQKTGKDFDKAYADLMVDDHQEDIDEFRKETEKGNDAELKAWATAKLPILAHHLEMAKLAREALKDEKKK